MSTKAQQILDPHSTWNQSPNNEPMFIVRAWQWQEVMYMALRKNDHELFKLSQEMKTYFDTHDDAIPF